MPRYIIKLPTPIGDRYLEWSSIVDAPITYGLTLEEFTDYYRSEYGDQGMRDLPDRMARVEATGTSERNSKSVAETVCCGAMSVAELTAYTGMTGKERRAYHDKHGRTEEHRP